MILSQILCLCYDVMDMMLISTLSFHQACTGIDDLGIAIMHLEEADWVLVVRKTYFKNLHFTMRE